MERRLRLAGVRSSLFGLQDSQEALFNRLTGGTLRLQMLYFIKGALDSVYTACLFDQWYRLCEAKELPLSYTETEALLEQVVCSSRRCETLPLAEN